MAAPRGDDIFTDFPELYQKMISATSNAPSPGNPMAENIEGVARMGGPSANPVDSATSPVDNSLIVTIQQILEAIRGLETRIANMETQITNLQTRMETRMLSIETRVGLLEFAAVTANINP
ncbi:hypothetical protein BsWGS_06166 [Bradybaena similaris]